MTLPGILRSRAKTSYLLQAALPFCPLGQSVMCFVETPLPILESPTSEAAAVLALHIATPGLTSVTSTGRTLAALATVMDPRHMSRYAFSAATAASFHQCNLQCYWA